jgi:branched-chain amino acid transport system permease protein
MLGLGRAEEAAMLGCAMARLRDVGLESLAWQKAGSLALGQQRILEIARALAADPILLLLDEPAAGLRHAEKQALAGQIRALRAQGLAVLLVEHDMDFVMTLADRVVVMQFGRVIASGTPQQVQNDPVVQDAYLGAEP